jgi:hypothetical protein
LPKLAEEISSLFSEMTIKMRVMLWAKVSTQQLELIGFGEEGMGSSLPCTMYAYKSFKLCTYIHRLFGVGTRMTLKESSHEIFRLLFDRVR